MAHDADKFGPDLCDLVQYRSPQFRAAASGAVVEHRFCQSVPLTSPSHCAGAKPGVRPATECKRKEMNVEIGKHSGN